MEKEVKDKGIGLVLEGGAQRGLFSMGIVDAMMEEGLYPNGLVGVSAGAAFGCNMKSRQPGRCIRYCKRFAHDWQFCSVRSLLSTGDLFGGEFDYHYLPAHLDIFDEQAFDANPMEFYAVCTDLETGKAEYKLLMRHSYECYEWIRASASMPIASKPVGIVGRKYLDGGIADSIPLRFFQSIGYRRCVVILTQPRDFVKKPSPMNPVIRLALRHYPAFTEASDHRHLMYNEELAYVRQEESLGNALVIAPEAPLPIHHITHDPQLMQHVYDLGRTVAGRRMGEIKRFFQA